MVEKIEDESIRGQQRMRWLDHTPDSRDMGLGGPWALVLEKTLESPLDCKEIQPVHSKGDPSWVFIGRTDVESETPILRPPEAES